MPLAAGSQEERLLKFPGKHVDAILPPYAASLVNCRMGPWFLLVHQSKDSRNDLLGSDLQFAFRELKR